MGILSSILGKVALPLGIAVVAGFLLVTFKDRITGAVTGGAQTLGSIISSPFGSILQGINEGFQNIPPFIDFRFPEFRFAFGDDNTTTQLVNGAVTVVTEPAPPDFVPIPPDPNAPSGCSIKQDAQGNVTTVCDSDTQVMGSPAPAPTIFEPTPFGDPNRRTFFDLLNLAPSSKGFLDLIRRDRTTLGELQESGKIVGLFDFLSTKGRTERVPLSLAQVQQFQGDIRLSAQLFEEFGSVKEVLDFA